jgi:hypothetical protein
VAFCDSQFAVAMLGVKVLERCLDELHILKKIAPTKMAPQARRNLGQV